VNQSLKRNFQYQVFTGGGKYNVLSDRDNMALGIAHTF